VIERSFARLGKIPVDENHATEKAAAVGQASPARGYVVEMEARADGLWGRVDWTNSGRELIEDRAYLGLSPVLMCARADRSTVFAIKSVALTNNPNLLGLTQLNAAEEYAMEELLAKLKKMLGLSEDEDNDQMWTTLHAVIDAAAAEKAHKASMTEAQSALSTVAKALGQPEDAAPEALVEAAQAAISGGSGDQGEVVAELQSALAETRTELNGILSERAKEKAELCVDGALAKGTAITAKMRGRLIEMHQADPDGTEALIADMPRIGGTSHTRITPPKAGAEVETVTQMNEAQEQAYKVLGLAAVGVTPEKYLETINARAQEA
jgi:phage I-like protein